MIYSRLSARASWMHWFLSLCDEHKRDTGPGVENRRKPKNCQGLEFVDPITGILVNNQMPVLLTGI